jgi:hypothetical protein
MMGTLLQLKVLALTRFKLIPVDSMVPRTALVAGMIATQHQIQNLEVVSQRPEVVVGEGEAEAVVEEGFLRIILTSQAVDLVMVIQGGPAQMEDLVVATLVDLEPLMETEMVGDQVEDLVAALVLVQEVMAVTEDFEGVVVAEEAEDEVASVEARGEVEMMMMTTVESLTPVAVWSQLSHGRITSHQHRLKTKRVFLQRCRLVSTLTSMMRSQWR